MKRLLFLVLFLSFIYAGASLADTPASRNKIVKTCHEYVLCSAQTATGDCTVLPASGDEITLEVFGQWSALTFFSNQSVGNYSCHIHGNSSGHDDQSGDFVQLSTTAITESNQAISLNGGNFGWIWVNCSAIATSVTMTVNVCPANL